MRHCVHRVYDVWNREQKPGHVWQVVVQPKNPQVVWQLHGPGGTNTAHEVNEVWLVGNQNSPAWHSGAGGWASMTLTHCCGLTQKELVVSVPGAWPQEFSLGTW